MKITLLLDNPNSWYLPHARTLLASLQRTHDAALIHRAADIPAGDIAFFLSCERIIPASLRARNTHTIVVHSSPLPKGKGWSPLTWQILEGKNEIVNTLFEAADAVDAGPIYMQNTMQFEGHELLPELHDIQGKAVNELVVSFLAACPDILKRGMPQTGEETFYTRRRPQDSELDPNKTIAEQFNLLRSADNETYPAFFHHRGRTYILKIYKKQDINDSSV